MSVSATEMHRRRLLLLAAFLVAFAALLTIRLTQWQIINHDKLLASAQNTHTNRVVLPPQRGEVRDRNGHILAISLREDQIQGDPTFFQKQRPSMQDYIVKTASSILNVPAEKLRQQLMSGTGYYTKIQDTVPLTVSKAINNAGISPAIAAVPKVRRFYPSHALLAHTLGFLNGEGEGIGIEGSYNQLLQGVAGEKVYEGETYGTGLAQIPSITPPQDGADITLTIDINIQYVAERELERALYAEKSTTGTVVVLDPKTGEILAMAGRPTFDPNEYSNVPPATWNNPVIVNAWEPGSIFKILTLAAALDAGKITPDTVFADRGKFKYGRVNITNMDDKSFGNITPAQICSTPATSARCRLLMF